MYEIVSKNGWRTCAMTEIEAKEIADMRHLQWWRMGVDLPVEVYFQGDLIYTAKGPHQTAPPGAK